MSKTVELQIEKGRSLVEGLRKHVKEIGENRQTADATPGAKNISAADIDRMEQMLNELIATNDEVDRLRDELQPKVKHMNEVLTSIKATYIEAKKMLKGYYPQEHWADYGIPDKR